MSHTLVSTFLIAENSPFFTDHFPGNPILPAFRQLEFVRECVEGNNKEKTIAAFQEVKFLQPILPEKSFRIEVEIQAESAHFFIRDDSQLMTKGRALLKLLPK